MKVPFKFTVPPPGWIDRFPDGNYTIGRGADPRALADPEQADQQVAGPKSKHARRTAKKQRPRTSEAAE